MSTKHKHPMPNTDTRSRARARALSHTLTLALCFSLSLYTQNNNKFSESKEDNCMPFPDLDTGANSQKSYVLRVQQRVFETPKP